jgi:hypothetical protein
VSLKIQRARYIPVLLGMVVLAATIALKLGAGSSHAAVSPTMHAVVREDASIGLTFDDGTEVGTQARTPPTIPPGTYTIRVVDSATTHNFHLSGPGVDMATPVDEMTTPTWTVTFQPGATYRFQCDEHADFMYGVFQTSGTSSSTTSGGTSAGGSTSGGASSGGSSSSGGTSSGTSSSGGSQPGLSGTLAGTVSAAGKLTLALRGKAVSNLTVGRYKVTVTDKSATTSFLVQKKGHAAITVSSRSFVGTRSVTVTFSPGTWSFYSPPSGSKRTFIVS